MWPRVVRHIDTWLWLRRFNESSTARRAILATANGLSGEPTSCIAGETAI
jgi:hypothetical protein